MGIQRHLTCKVNSTYDYDINGLTLLYKSSIFLECKALAFFNTLLARNVFYAKLSMSNAKRLTICLFRIILKSQSQQHSEAAKIKYDKAYCIRNADSEIRIGTTNLTLMNFN